MSRTVIAFTCCCMLVTHLGCSSSTNSSGSSAPKDWTLESLKGPVTFKGHTGPVLEVALCRDGRRAASRGMDKTLRIWDVATGNEIRSVKPEMDIGHIAITPDGRQVVYGGWKRIVKGNTATDRYFLAVCDTETGAELGRTEETDDAVDSLVISADGRRALSGGNTHTYLWDLSTKRLLRKYDDLNNHSYAVAFSPDGRSGMTVSGHSIVVLDLDKGSKSGNFSQHKEMPVCLAFSPDGKRALSGGHDSLLILWEPATGKEIRSWNVRGPWVKQVAFLPDGKQAVSRDGKGAIRVWEVESAKQVAEMPDLQGEGMALSTDGIWVLHGNRDGSVTLRPLPN
jgi:WD40 repeat protein